MSPCRPQFRPCPQRACLMCILLTESSLLRLAIMETIPLDIPGAKFQRSNSTNLSRQASLLLSSSYFCASSLNHPRNSGVTLSVPVNDPGMERRLSRTRKMSEAIHGASLKRITTIPTVKEDITKQVSKH